MDLSKLYLEKEYTTQEQAAAERIITSWADDLSRTIEKKDTFIFKNIKCIELPAYYFKFDFQLGTRTYYKEERAYTGREDIPQTPATLDTFGFNTAKLPDVSVEDTYDNDSRMFPGSHILYKCPTCRGEKGTVCSTCRGEGTEPCPKCKNSPDPGYIRCPNCKDGWQSDGSRCGRCRGGWLACPQCRGSKHPGVITCRTCNGNGEVSCRRCNGSGKVVEYVALNQSFEPLKDSKYYKCLWHITVPNALKILLTGGRADVKLNTSMLRAYSESNSIEDSEDIPSEVFNAFNKHQLYSLRDKYKELLDEVINIYEVNNDFSKGVDRFTSKKITKVRTQICKINISHITYEWNDKKYELWLYGNHNEIFSFDSPCIEFAEQNAKIAKDFQDKKKYVEAIKPLEAACKIADKSGNHQLFNNYIKLLKESRKKSKIDYNIGLLIGLGLVSIFQLLPLLPRVNNYLVLLLNIKSEELAGILRMLTALFINIITPGFLSSVIFKKIIRDKLKHKVLRIMSSISLPVTYILIVKLSTYFMQNTDKFLLIGSTIVFCICLILVYIKKVPYQDYKMTTYIKPKIIDKYDNKITTKTEKIMKDTSDSDNVSPKRRTVALILSLFLGVFGIHSFYVGKFLRGCIQFSLSIIGFYLLPRQGASDITSTREAMAGICLSLLELWALVDFILILIGKFRDKNRMKIIKWW